jgi:hypothetical protein
VTGLGVPDGSSFTWHTGPCTKDSSEPLGIVSHRAWVSCPHEPPTNQKKMSLLEAALVPLHGLWLGVWLGNQLREAGLSRAIRARVPSPSPPPSKDAAFPGRSLQSPSHRPDSWCPEVCVVSVYSLVDNKFHAAIQFDVPCRSASWSHAELPSWWRFWPRWSSRPCLATTAYNNNKPGQRALEIWSPGQGWAVIRSL